MKTNGGPPGMAWMGNSLFSASKRKSIPVNLSCHSFTSLITRPTTSPPAIPRPMHIAILDLYEGQVNEGMRCILQLVAQFKAEAPIPVEHQVFDVRLKNEIADLSFDAYISSGGPGSPIASQGSEWEQNYFGLMKGILEHNRNNPFQRKHVFLICHSFQIFCRYYGYPKVSKLKSTSFGALPILKTKMGFKQPLFAGLDGPYS